jgi:hypothetical protein
MTFTPAVVSQFAGTRLDRFKYRGAILDIEIRGYGTVCEINLDGARVMRIDPSLTGRHTVVLVMQ